MPNRIIREGILTSDRVNTLDWQAEVFYRRLLSVVDDFGRFDARPKILLAALFPLKQDSLSEPDMERMLTVCQDARLIVLYTVNGKPYLNVLDFNQQIRAKRSKFPDPHSTCAADAAQMMSKTANLPAKPGSETPNPQNQSKNDETGDHADGTDGARAADAQHMRTKAETHSNALSKTKAEAQPPGAAEDSPAQPLEEGGMQRPPRRDAVEQPREGRVADFKAAIDALDAWAMAEPPIGRGYVIALHQNEHRPLLRLLEELDTQPPIPRSGELVPRRHLIAQAIHVLVKQRKDFRSVSWACGCVKGELRDWGNGSTPANGKAATPKVSKPYFVRRDE